MRQKILATLILAGSILFMFSMCGCHTPQNIEYIIKESHDTLYKEIHDSIFHEIKQNGDTVYSTKYVTRTKVVERIVHDVDTIQETKVEYIDREVVVEKKIVPKWCYLSMLVCVPSLIVAVYKIKSWVKRF